MAKVVRRISSRTGKRSAVQKEFDKFISRKVIFLVSLPILLFLIAGISSALGSANITVWDAYAAILHRVPFLSDYFPSSWLADTCVWNLRLPRIVWGLMAGFGLGIAGCAMQAILRNPLASPYTLGITAGANFGVSLGVVLNLGFFGGMYLLIGNAFVFSMLCSGLILGLSRVKGGTAEILILAGIAINYIFTAVSSLFKYFATDQQLQEMAFWGGGDLGRFSWEEIGIVAVMLVVSSCLLMTKAWDLNVITLGDNTAKSLGVDSGYVRLFVMATSSFLIAGIVCFIGTIGFIGLVAPHMSRMVIGGDNRFQLPASGLVGAVTLATADVVARRIMAPNILPVGTITSIIGIPFFFYLIMKRRREYW
jgi:iron complex transport system permease protein